MKNKALLCLVLGISFFICVIYFLYAYTPIYDEKVTVDIRNDTIQEYNNISITGEYFSKIEISKIKPLQRIIVILPRGKEYGRGTSIFLEIKDKEYIIIPKYRIGSSDTARVIIKNGEPNISYQSVGNIFEGVNLRPFTKVYDVEGDSWDGIPPIIKALWNMIKIVK